MDDSENPVSRGPKSRTPLLAYAISVVALLSILCEGYDMGASSGALLLVQESGSITLTPLWQQMVIAGPLPTATLSTLIAARVSDKFGRKKGLITSSIFFMLGAAITIFSSTRQILLLGRLILGCGYGFSSAITAMYIAECSPHHIRGRLIGMSQPFMTLGTLLATVISGFFSYNKTNGWRFIWGFQGILGAVQFFGMLLLPESPRWFIQKSRKKEARDILMRIRNGENVDEEILEIEENFQEVQRSNEKSDTSCGFCFEDTNDIINGICRPVSSSSNMLSQEGACNSSATNLEPVKTWAYDYCPVSFSWVAVLGLALFLMFYAPSVGPLPWTINAEIYPLWARSSGNGLASMTCGFCNLISTATFLAFVRAVHSYGVFYVMAFIALAGSVFCYYFLPETKNKTLEEIETLFKPKKNKRLKNIRYRAIINGRRQEIKERNDSC